MKTIKKIILSLVTGASSLIIAACYGMPSLYDGNYRPVRIKIKDGANVPITGLEVKVNSFYPSENIPFDSTEGYTDSSGEFLYYHINDSYNYTVDVTDIDGALNGGDFASKTFPITEDSYYDVTLEKK